MNVLQKFTLFFAISAVIGFSSSCTQNPVEEAIKGRWSIDTLIFKNSDIRSCLLVNIIAFNEDSCELPVIENRCEGFNSFDNRGLWKINKSKNYIMWIKTKNELFSDTVSFHFGENKEKKLFYIILNSPRIHMICHKGFFDYDAHANQVRELIEETLAK